MKKVKRSNSLSHDEIAKLAYSFFEERGHKHGHDVEDWLAAEAHVCTDNKHVSSSAKIVREQGEQKSNGFALNNE
ncbi:MAG: DUF2934 domain-containing protein [Verrucomicrobiales bacterium]|nr:DUF2934 domain-containing protein [Verrucomicrobiales bacterium]